MPNKKPEPIFRASKPNVCPGCGQASYSAAGIHPQCAVKLADEKRRAEIKLAEAEAAGDKKKTAGQTQPSRWQKICPKCKQAQHVRKKECDCGNVFAKTLPNSA